MFSRISCYIILAVYLSVRLVSIDYQESSKNKFTDSDGLGYYIYLPAIIIHQDITEYKWLPEIEKKYKVYGGGQAYQISQHENGNFVTNYLGGVAIMQLPFFLAGHLVALSTDFPADGFSPPYQIAIGFAPFFYLCFFLFLLRNVLLRYYDDHAVAIGLALMFLASNAIEYIAIEAGQCHGYILPMYVLILYLSIKWHSNPKISTAYGIGITIGLATIMRPTELIIVLIPLLWNTHTKDEKKKKWKLVQENRNHVFFAILGSFLASLPQLIYWYYVTGSFFNSVGSKWRFLDPYWRVLVGWEKGWFIYTPITILFVLGLFFMKNKPFRKSVVWFCLINIWIIISWNNWHYGGSYSTRALVQSYPVFALAFTAVVARILDTKWKKVFYSIGFYLICVNIFQVWQYRQTIIHYRDMNFAYYRAVYLDRNPTPLDMSLLDGGEKVESKLDYKSVIMSVDSAMNVSSKVRLYSGEISNEWEGENIAIEIYLDMLVNKGYWDGLIYIKFYNGITIVSEKSLRTFNAMTKKGERNAYRMQVSIPRGAERVEIGFLEEGFLGVVYHGEVLEFVY